LADVRKGSEREGLYDTSKCNVKFRRPRILQSRSLSFDHRRKLGFEPNRRIKARLSGVVFRRKAAIGFRNVGISNLEEVMDRDDWPEVGKAQLPDTLRLERRKDWSRTWGQAFQMSFAPASSRSSPRRIPRIPARRAAPV
jgi:hypothetical protein